MHSGLQLQHRTAGYAITLTGQFHVRNASENELILVHHHGPSQTPAPPLARTSF